MIEHVPISKVKANPFNPRKEYDSESIAELAAAMKSQGVFRGGSFMGRRVNGHVQLAFGHRRFAAMKKNGVQKIEVDVQPLTDEDMKTKALVENIQRKDLTEIEKADAVAAMCENRTQVEVAKELGLSRPYIVNLCAVSTLPQSLKMAVDAGRITAQAAAIARRVAGTEFAEKVSSNNIPQNTVARIAGEIGRITDPKIRERVKQAARRGSIKSEHDVVKKAVQYAAPKSGEDVASDLSLVLHMWTLNLNTLATVLEPVAPHGWAVRNPKLNNNWEKFEKSFSRLADAVEAIRRAPRPKESKESAA